MSSPAPQLVQKLWNYCNILRDDITVDLETALENLGAIAEHLRQWRIFLNPNHRRFVLN
jgi:hypothetical protein